MPALVVETQCLATVTMETGRQFSLLKFEDETITPSLNPSRGKLERGKFYRVTIEEIEGINNG